MSSCLTLGNGLSKEAQVTLLGRGPLGGQQEGKGTQENCSAMWLEVSGFMMVTLSINKQGDDIQP